MGDKVDKMPDWPERLAVHDGYGGCADCEDYERARADAAMARLRVAISRLSWTAAQIRRGSPGIALVLDIDETIAAIGSLPPDPTEGG